MTLAELLGEATPLAVDTLPDDRLINVVLEGGVLYGVQVDNIPPNVSLTRREPVVRTGTVLEVDGLAFDIMDYELL